MILKDRSIVDAFERFNMCGSHSDDECKVLNKLFNMALQIERGFTPDEAFEQCRDD